MTEIAATSPAAPLKKASGWGIAFAILIILAGIIAIILPFTAGIAITIVIGWLLVVSGVFHLVDAFHAKGVGAFFWRLLVGIVYIVGGLDIAFHPAWGLVVLAFVLAIILMVQGIFTLIGFFRHRKMHGAGWMLFNGIVTILLSLIIWWDGPEAARWVIGTLIGIHLIFSGVSRLMIWSAVRKSASAAPA